MFGPIIIRSTEWMEAFERFVHAERFSPAWRAALAEMQAEAPQSGPCDCTDIAREDAQMRHDEDVRGV